MKASFIFTIIISLVLVSFSLTSYNSSIDPTSINKNRGLKGKLFLGGNGEGWIMDLSTGKYNKIPGIDWNNSKKKFHSMARFSAFPIEYSGNEFLVKIRKCKRSKNPKYPSYYNDCLGIYNKDGNIVKSTTLFEKVLGEPKLSRDGKKVAFFYDNKVDGIAPSIIVTTRNFEPISAIQSKGYNVSPSLSWTPNGKIVYHRKQSIYITNKEYTSSSPIITFNKEQGEPKQVTVSPDGTKIIFILQTDATFRTRTATPWMININGTGLRQLAHTKKGQRSSFENPTWSPDGKHILFTHGRISAATDLDLGLIGGAYIIPSDSENILLSNNSSKIIHVQSYFSMKQNRSGSKLSTQFSVKNGSIAWLP